MLPLNGKKSGINVGFIMKTLLRGDFGVEIRAKPNKKWGVEELPPSFISSK